MADEPTTPQKKALSAQEGLFFFTIVKNMKNKADVDWDTIATELGFKNAGVAKVRFGQIKRKLGLESESPTKTNDRASPQTPSKVTKPGVTGGSAGKVRRSGGGGRGKGKTVKTKDSDDDLGGPLALNPKTLIKKEIAAEEEEDDGAVFGCIDAAS